MYAVMVDMKASTNGRGFLFACPLLVISTENQYHYNEIENSTKST